LLDVFDFTAVYPATAVSGSKEAIAPSQIKRPLSEVGVRLLSQAAAGPSDVGDVSHATDDG